MLQRLSFLFGEPFYCGHGSRHCRRVGVSKSGGSMASRSRVFCVEEALGPSIWVAPLIEIMSHFLNCVSIELTRQLGDCGHAQWGKFYCKILSMVRIN